MTATRTIRPRAGARLAISLPRLGLAPSDAVIGAALGLLIVAVSFGLERTGHDSALSGIVFWTGFVILVAPIALRLLAQDTRRPERIALAMILGAMIYAVKVLHDPLQFVLADEFLHLVAAQHVVASHSLFAPFSVSGGQIAADFPGLEALTASLSEVSGLSLFVSGLVVIGTARTMMMLAVYLFAERVSGSPRVAGITALLFAANANFLFWSAQFAYESLAFPLFMVALVALVTRSETGAATRPLTAVAAILIAALTATHHLTSYALVLMLWLFSALSVKREFRASRALGLAVFATVAAALWFALVAAGTRAYLGYIAGHTLTGIGQLLSGAGARVPFAPTGTPRLQSPLPERIVAYAALILVGGGLVAVFRAHKRFACLHSAAGTIVIVASLGFLALYPLRASAAAWETANRGQEIVFPGVAMLLALGIVRLLDRDRTFTGPAMLGAVLVVICGGVISGWPYPLRLSQPLKVLAPDGRVLVPEGAGAAAWAIRHLGGRGVTYVADVSSGRELAVDGAGSTYLGGSGEIAPLLEAPTLAIWQNRLLEHSRVDYVLLDRRKRSQDNLAGYFFATRDDPGGGLGYYSRRVGFKYGAVNASAVYASGDIVIYDVAGLHQLPPACGQVGSLSVASGITCRRGRSIVTFSGSDGTATLAGFRLRYLGGWARASPDRLAVTLLVDEQNFTRRTVAPDPDWQHITLTVARRVLGRLRVAHDNLSAQTVLGPDQSVVANVTFVIDGRRLIAGAEAHGAELDAAAPRILGMLSRVGARSSAPPAAAQPPIDATAAVAVQIRSLSGLG